jgi:hypothetical protein
MGEQRHVILPTPSFILYCEVEDLPGLFFRIQSRTFEIGMLGKILNERSCPALASANDEKVGTIAVAVWE